MDLSAPPVKVYAREEQIQRFGIDCGDGINYRGGEWVPGGEYVLPMVVANTSAVTQKLRYKLPKTKFFSMAFPETITLPPGMRETVDVVFRPTHLEEYDDVIRIYVHSVHAGQPGANNSFLVPVTARLAHLSVTAPEGLDLGFVPTAELAEQKFLVSNMGQVPATFSWDVAPPFTLTPASGHLEEGECAEIVCGICPASASVFVSRAVLTYAAATDEMDAEFGVPAQSDSLCTKLSAIGKYSHLSCSESYFDFGEILVGGASTDKAPTEREFCLSNVALVHATWKIVAVEDEATSGMGPVFAFSQYEGRIEPEGDVHIKVRYTPRSGGAFSCEAFDIVTPGANSVRITLKGSAIGPAVTVFKAPQPVGVSKTAPTSVQFGDVRVGESCGRAVVISNTSGEPAHWSFVCEDKGVFHFDRVSGIVAPHLTAVVNLHFSPAATGNFYRRVTLLVQHQMPLFLDLLATGYSEHLRPEPLLQVHVDAYRNRVREGMQLASMAELDEMVENGDKFLNVRPNKTCVGTALERRLHEDTQLTRSGEARRTQALVAAEFFALGADVAESPASLDQPELDFGGCTRRSAPPPQVVRVTNRSHAKVNCLWRVPGSDDADAVVDFDVSPPAADILPGHTMEFRVAFKPSQDNFYYSQELEAYVTFKAARNFRLVNGQTLNPPWCLTTRVLGHTFGSVLNLT